MVYYTYKWISFLLLYTKLLYWSFYVLLWKWYYLCEVFIKSYEHELEALGLVFGTIFALTLYYMEQFAV